MARRRRGEGLQIVEWSQDPADYCWLPAYAPVERPACRGCALCDPDEAARDEAVWAELAAAGL